MSSPRKSVIVTGGASGIGLAMTKHFASSGHQVAILDVNDSTGPKIAADVAQEYPDAAVSFHKCDCSSWESQAAVFKEVVKQHGGRLDVTMANAGIATEYSPHWIELRDGEPEKPDLATANVNYVGVIYTVKLAIHYMGKSTPIEGSKTHGSIICTASNAGLYPFPVAPLYASTKAGVIGLVRALARPLQKLNIQINALAPAVLDTNIAPAFNFATSMVVTPFSTLTRGVAQLTDDPSLTGQIAEIHGNSVTLRDPPSFVDEDSEKNVEMFWTVGSSLW